MFYDLKCSCSVVTEFMMGMEEVDKIVYCPSCNKKINRREHRVLNAPQIITESGPRGVSYNYWDENLETHVKNKQHRKDLMEEKGLTEYNPDLSMKKHRDEARYIREQALPNDEQAKAAIRKEYKTAHDTRLDRNVRNSLEQSFKEINA